MARNNLGSAGYGTTASTTFGTVFVTRVDEVEPLVLYQAGSIVPGDAVRHPAEGPCLVLARLGDHLMVEADQAPPEEAAEHSRSA